MKKQYNDTDAFDQISSDLVHYWVRTNVLGKVNTTKILSAAKSNPNIINKDGNTLLHSAAAVGNEKDVKILLAAGVDVNIVNKNGQTAMQVAVQYHHHKIARIFKGAASSVISGFCKEGSEMGKKIELIKIVSAEQEISMLNITDKEELDIIEHKKACGFYEHTKIDQFGCFMIMLDGQLVGGISLNTRESFVSNGTVNIEFCYSLAEQARGKGLMIEALQLAVQYIKTVQDAHQDITFIEYDGYNPEKHKLLTAQKIGEVYASIIDISNYPSLSCCIKAGGKVEGLRGGGSIKVKFFLDQELTSHFSEALTSDLMKYSKTLCQLGFNNRPTPPTTAEKHQAFEVSQTFIKQVAVEDVGSLSTIKFFVNYEITKTAQDLTDAFAQPGTDYDLFTGSEVSSAAAGSTRLPNVENDDHTLLDIRCTGDNETDTSQNESC